MQTFKQFLLTESLDAATIEELNEYIRAHCRPALDLIQQQDVVFYRGLSKSSLTELIEDYPGPGEMKAGEVMVRKDRRPRNTPQFAHDFIDEWFNERFGFKARSEGLFVIGNPAEATGYGTACIVLPIGEFSTYSSTKIEDLTQKLFPDHNWEQNSGPIGGHSAWPAGDPDEEQQLQLAKIVLDGADYEKNDIVGMAKNTKMEIMIDCDKFVAIYAFSLPNALKILREL